MITDLFAEGFDTAEIIADMTEEQMREMGLLTGHRFRLNKIIQNLKSGVSGPQPVIHESVLSSANTFANGFSWSRRLPTAADVRRRLLRLISASNVNFSLEASAIVVTSSDRGWER